MERKAIEGHAEEWLKAVSYIDQNWNQPDFLAIVPRPDVLKYFLLRNHFDDKSRLVNTDSLKSECKELDKRTERLFKKGYRDYSNFLKIFCNQFKQYYLNANETDYSVFHAFLKEKNWTPLSIEDVMNDSEEKQKEEDRRRKEEEYRRYEQERKNNEEKRKREERRKEKEDSKWRYNKQKRNNNWGYTKQPIVKKVVLFAVLFLAVAIALYKFWYTPYATDRDAPRYYTFTNLNLRSSQIADVEYNLLGLLPYGTELITYSVGDEWADVKAHGKKGFVASSLVLPSEDFHLLNSAWGNSDAKECIATAKCRLAVLDYYKRCNLKGGIEWQVYTKKKEDRQNNVFFPRVCDRNSKFTDFAFIIKNNQTQKRMFALYSFDDETEAPVFRYDMEAPEEGYIKNIESYRNYSSLRLVVSYSNGRRQTATLNNVAPTQPSRPVQPSVSSSQHTSPAPAVNKMSAQELNQQGDIYYEKKEYQQAISYYKKAAENGYSEAFANLGWIYYRGLGVPVDGAIAISYLKDAMAMGNLNAGFYLGLLYEHGIGNRFYDMDKALAAYKQAAYGGHEKAIESLKRLADNGNRFACLYIATLYKDGVANGDFQNKEQAVHYYRLAAEKGMDEAINALKELNVESN